MNVGGPVAAAVAEGRLPGRVWFYSTYACNLACTYCLTESAPGVARRALAGERMVELAAQAANLGFTDLGVTGGEPFLSPELPTVLAEMAAVLPTVVLTNGTLFNDVRLATLRPLAGLPVRFQISLDSHEPTPNDAARGPGNFAKVVEAIPRLIDAGVSVRVATTIDGTPDPEAMARLCELHRSLGVTDDNHVVRPVVRRGRARVRGEGVAVGSADLPAELTVSADGAFWSPFGPTVTGGVLDTDLLLTRTTDPLRIPAEALLRLVDARPDGADARTGIQ
ncbi:MAG: radical SAM protein [Acidimicrobiales bacterium]